MTNSSFTVTCNAGVSEIVLSRAQHLNSMTLEFFREFPAAISEIDNAGETRAIIISAEGSHFCAGLDLSVFQEDIVSTQAPIERERFRRLALEFQRVISCVESCRIPVIAAIHGACVGGGLDLIAACDLRFAVESSTFCIQEINLGIMADLGSLQRLPKLMAPGIVRELAYTGDRFDAARGLQYGLLNQIFESHEEMMAHARGVARRIALRSPIAVRATKESITYARDHSVDDALLHAAALQASIFDKEQIMNEIVAQKKKSTVTYEDPKKLEW